MSPLMFGICILIVGLGFLAMLAGIAGWTLYYLDCFAEDRAVAREARREMDEQLEIHRLEALYWAPSSEGRTVR